MKHVLLLLLLVAVSITKPTDNAKETEKSLQYDISNVDAAKSLPESILTKRRPIIIKSKIRKPKTKKRLTGANSKTKTQAEPDLKKSAITFALDSDDNSLSSIISMILKLIDEEEHAEINSKKTNLNSVSNSKSKNKEISEIPATEPNTVLPKLSLSEQNVNFTLSTEVTLTNQISQTSFEPAQLLNSNPQVSTTAPSNFILETSVSFEPPFDNNSITSKESKQSKKKSSSDSNILKIGEINNEEEASGDFSYETDDDTHHYCPEGLKDDDKNNTEDSIVHLDKLISSSENDLESPLETTSAPEALTTQNSELQIETTSTPLAINEFETKSESTTLESLNIDARLSETTTISSNFLTNVEEIVTSAGPSNYQELYTTEKQNEATTYNSQYSNDLSTEKDNSLLFTTSEPQISETVETTMVNKEFVNQEITTLPAIMKINKFDSNVVTESPTNILIPHKDISYEFTKVTKLPLSQASSIASTITSTEEVLNKVYLTQETLPSESFVESSPYPTTSITELRLFENQTDVANDVDNKVRDVLKPSTQLIPSEAAAVSPESIVTTQRIEIISPPSSLSPFDMNTSSLGKVEQQENVAAKSAKPHSRLITFTLFDRKEKYTSLKHFIDYLRTLKK